MNPVPFPRFPGPGGRPPIDDDGEDDDWPPWEESRFTVLRGSIQFRRETRGAAGDDELATARGRLPSRSSWPKNQPGLTSLSLSRRQPSAARGRSREVFRVQEVIS